MDTAVVLEYQRALEEFRRACDAPPPFFKRMSELISLLDLTTTLSSGLSSQEILEAALLIVMGELQCTRGCILVRASGGFVARAARGLAVGATLKLPDLDASDIVLSSSAGALEVMEPLGLEVLCPIVKGGRPVAVLGLGKRAGGTAFGSGEIAFLKSVAACAATPIENGLIHEELQRVNQRLSVKIFQLNGLFDISRELTASLDEETVASLLSTTLLGQLMVSRCALYLRAPDGLRLAHSRGVGFEERQTPPWGPEVEQITEGLRGPCLVGALRAGPLQDYLRAQRLALLVPLRSGENTAGFMALGERISGLPFSEEDYDFAQTLGRQAMAALETVKLHRIRVEKQRRDRELQIAREIQQSLFPQSWPGIAGFEVAARSEACHEVGGDHYDVIPLDDGRVALAIADVSGKGTPASLLMASVHAWLRALAGTTNLDAFLRRLNTFLYQSTQANRYVTLFYGELDSTDRSFRYANGGHVPPFVVRADGRCERLTEGGPVLGLLEQATFDTGLVHLRPGDALVAVTDGATEATSAGDIEFGDERISDTILSNRAARAPVLLDRLVEAVHAWNGPAGCSDDLTILVLKAIQET